MADPKNREAPSSRVSAGGGAITESLIKTTELLVDVPHALAFVQTLRLLPHLQATVVLDGAGEPIYERGFLVVAILGEPESFLAEMQRHHAYCRVIGPRGDVL
jgi:hypothetical protein